VAAPELSDGLDLTGTEGISLNETWDADYARLLERAQNRLENRDVEGVASPPGFDDWWTAMLVPDRGHHPWKTAQPVRQEFPLCRIVRIDEQWPDEHPMTYLDENRIILPVGGPGVPMREITRAVNEPRGPSGCHPQIKRWPRAPSRGSQRVIRRRFNAENGRDRIQSHSLDDHSSGQNSGHHLEIEELRALSETVSICYARGILVRSAR